MKIFLSSCLFLAILSEVIALQCSVKKPGGKASSIKACHIKDVTCFTHITLSNLNGSSKREIESGCTADCTSEDYSFTGDGSLLRNFRFCCRGLDCTRKLFSLPKPHLNGKECPTCFPALSEACKGSKTIKCRNDETQCIEFVVAHDDSAIPDKHFHGCAAPKLCELAKNSMHSDALSGTITQARCTDTLPSLEQLNFEG